jgi:hypothetical protein
MAGKLHYALHRRRTFSEHDCMVYSWGLMLQSKCPSALTSFKQIVANAQGRRIAVFLDYDGTLSPIVDDPDKAFMSPVVNQNSLFQVLSIT